MAARRKDSLSSADDENPFVHDDDDDWAAVSDNARKDSEVDLAWAEEDVQDEAPTSSEAVVVSAPMSENSAEKVLDQLNSTLQAQAGSEELDRPPTRVLSNMLEGQQEHEVRQEAADPIVQPIPANSPAGSTTAVKSVPAAPAAGAAGAVAATEGVQASANMQTPGCMQISRGIESHEAGTAMQQRAHSQQHGAASTRAGGWGWNSTWSLGALKTLAVGAVRDVKELTGSLQQALAEVEDESTDEEGHREAPGTPNKQVDPKNTQLQQPDKGKQVSSTALPQGDVAPLPPVPAALPAPLVADREPGQETNPELEDVDQQVEMLTVGAAKALSSLWGGLSGVARNTVHLVSKVEAVTLDLAKDLVSGTGVSHDVAQLQAAAVQGVRGVAVNVGRIGTRLEAGLETVGRTAMGLLEEVTGQHAPSGKGRAAGSRDSGHPEGLAGSKSYEDLFDLYGGHQVAEQLETLANECARIANRARTRLEAGQQAELDEVLALLGPIFSQPLTSPAAALHSTTGALAGPSKDEEETLQAAQEQLEQRYVPVRFLCQDSLARAHAFQALLLEAVKTAAANHNPSGSSASTTLIASVQGGDEQTQDMHPAATTMPRATSSPVPDADGWDEGDLALDDSTADEQPTSGVAAVHAALLQLQGHALKRLAELVTAQLQLLMDNGTNLASPARSTEVQAGSINWPPKARQQAQLLRSQAQQMVQDMMAVGSTYAAAIQAVLPHLQAARAVQGPATEATSGSAQQAVMSATTQKGQSAETGAATALTSVVADLKMADDRSLQKTGRVSWEEAQELGLHVQQAVLDAHKAAVCRVEESFRGLLYAVLVRELVQRIAGAPVTQAEQQ